MPGGLRVLQKCGSTHSPRPGALQTPLALKHPGVGGPRFLLLFNFFYQDFLLLPLPARLLLVLLSFLAIRGPPNPPLCGQR